MLAAPTRHYVLISPYLISSLTNGRFWPLSETYLRPAVILALITAKNFARRPMAETVLMATFDWQIQLHYQGLSFCLRPARSRFKTGYDLDAGCIPAACGSPTSFCPARLSSICSSASVSRCISFLISGEMTIKPTPTATENQPTEE